MTHELSQDAAAFAKRIQSQETKYASLLEKRASFISNKASDNFFNPKIIHKENENIEVVDEARDRTPKSVLNIEGS